MKVEGLNILITGGAGGIGRHLVESLVNKAAKVNVIDIETTQLNELKAKFNQINTYECDVTDYKKVTETIDNIYNDCQKIDILINNAGWIYSAPLINLLSKDKRRHSPEIWHKVIDVNLSSVFYVTSCIVDKMIEKRTKGLIINFTSISANGAASQTAYAAAKAGVKALTAVWSKELAIYGIRSAAISPGMVDSPSTQRDLTDIHVKNWKKMIPQGRFATMDEILSGINFIIENDHFNGKALQIDGGLVY